MTLSLRLDNATAELIKQFAELNNLTVSEFLRQAALERIEDEIDLTAYNEAMKEFEQDATVYSHNEVKKLLGLK